MIFGENNTVAVVNNRNFVHQLETLLAQYSEILIAYFFYIGGVNDLVGITNVKSIGCGDRGNEAFVVIHVDLILFKQGRGYKVDLIVYLANNVVVGP